MKIKTITTACAAFLLIHSVVLDETDGRVFAQEAAGMEVLHKTGISMTDKPISEIQKIVINSNIAMEVYSPELRSYRFNNVGKIIFKGETSSIPPLARKPETVEAVITNLPSGVSLTLNLKSQGFLRIYVYNITGQSVKELANNNMQAGNLTVSWDGTDSKSNPVPAGVYSIQVYSDGSVVAGRRVVINR
jgi:hypothetical protein